MLKSSNRIQELDLNLAHTHKQNIFNIPHAKATTTKIKPEEGEEKRSEVVLVLRKWSNLLPSMDFRCIVRRGQLVRLT